MRLAVRIEKRLCHVIICYVCLCVQDVLLYYGAKEYGTGPIALGVRSPRESYNIESENFIRERGSYQDQPEHP